MWHTGEAHDMANQGWGMTGHILMYCNLLPIGGDKYTELYQRDKKSNEAKYIYQTWPIMILVRYRTDKDLLMLIK